jgi:hypothetical protein
MRICATQSACSPQLLLLSSRNKKTLRPSGEQGSKELRFFSSYLLAPGLKPRSAKLTGSHPPEWRYVSPLCIPDVRPIWQLMMWRCDFMAVEVEGS